MVMILLKEFDLLSDIFESCQSFDQLYIIFFCNGSCHFSGNDSCYNCTVFRKHAKFFSLGKKVFQDQHSGHISCEAFVLTGLLILCIDSKSVCIRVSSQNDICVHFCCKFQGQCKCVLIFRVRIAYCGEISVRKFLLFYYINIVKSKFFQYTSYRNVSCSVKRCINDLQLVCLLFDGFRAENQFLKSSHIFIIDLFTDHFVKTCCLCIFLGHRLHLSEICDRLNFCDDLFVLRSCDLCAVLPVNFVSVVLWRIVACSYYHTSCAA